ncbi:MAG: response regulator transcription factor [Schleiferiaceae bacterium]|nr:response regulator transcription factor [Schleiferiaceae bacterium]
MIKVLIADDHAVVRKGLKLYLGLEENIEIVGEAIDGEDLMNKIKTEAVDVLLLDIDMPKMNGITAIRHLVSEVPDVKIIILSMHAEEIYGATSYKFGARGYVSKDADPAVVISAINAVHNGGIFYSTNPTVKNKREAESAVKLSKREIEVLKLISAGRSNKDISEELRISDKTVSTYKQRLMSKLGAKSVVDLINYSKQV